MQSSDTPLLPPRAPTNRSRIPSLFSQSTSKLPSPLSCTSPNSYSPGLGLPSPESQKPTPDVRSSASSIEPSALRTLSPQSRPNTVAYESDLFAQENVSKSCFLKQPSSCPAPLPLKDTCTSNGDNVLENGQVGEVSGQEIKTKNNIIVAVRFRPLSDREKSRGDKELWGIDNKTNVGLISNGTVIAKYAYDIVFPQTATNKHVFDIIARPLISPAMNGINGTVFAYGVTSSGKTYTMMGIPGDPGLVHRTIRDIFGHIERNSHKMYLIRISMLEIYNEVLNDLLEPSRSNLKIREDLHRGVTVDGLTEEVVVSSDHALALIAAGDAHRKVSATAYNEDSSRSHTICRLSIESSDRKGKEMGSNTRTLAFLNLIDLAGSESARATVNKGQRMEGSFINKSLLTLGTVIHKLADGNAAHVPFRDSKLTRLLQSSLSGTGAKVAVVCNMTPAAAQAEETHNTLKFATRAKMVRIAVSKNEILDDKSLIRRYQREIQELKQQLSRLSTNTLDTPRSSVSLDTDNKGQDQTHSAELVALRSRLESEMQARAQQEQERVLLEARLRGLARLVLHSSQQTPNSSRPQKRSAIKRSASCESLHTSNSTGPALEGSPLNTTTPIHRYNKSVYSGGSQQSTNSLSSLDNEQQVDSSGALRPMLWSKWSGQTAQDTPSGTLGDRGNSELPSPSIASMQSNLDMQAGSADGFCEDDSNCDLECEALREQIRLLTDELQDKESDLNKPLHSTGFSSVATSEKDVELQVLYADREVLQDQLMISESTNERLRQEIMDLRADMEQLRRINEQLSALNHQCRIELDHLKKANPSANQLPTSPLSAETSASAASMPAQNYSQQPAFDINSFADLTASLHANISATKNPELWARLQLLEEQVSAALQEVAKKDEVIAAERLALYRIRELEANVEQQYEIVSVENQSLREEIRRLELANNCLQGYMLDTMTPDELSALIVSLTQAVERVRVTVQIRRVTTAPSMN